MTAPNAVTVATETRWGRLEAIRQDVYIGWSLLAYGEFSPAEWRFLVSLIQPLDWVLDIGCNIGAIAAPLIAAGARVIGVEAQPELAAIADRNCVVAGRRPGAGFAEVHPVACGPDAGAIEFPVLDLTQPGNFGGYAGGRGAQCVRMVTVDALVGDRGPIRLLKADVEGMELEVLAGAELVIARDRPLLYLEADREAHTEALLDWLVEHRYRWHWHRPPLFSADNFRSFPCCLPHLANVVSVNVIAIPLEQPVADWETAIAMGTR